MSLNKNNMALSDEIVLKEDEYFNMNDGLIYCKKCNTPRQVRVKFLKVEKICNCSCACKVKENEEKERQEQARKLRLKADSLRAVGFDSKALKDCTFANDSGGNPEMVKAKKYVENWDYMHKNAQGLLLFGPVGTGKTFMAGCIANALIDMGHRVYMTNFSNVLNRLTNMYRADRDEYLESLSSCSLLIIDDLGAERKTEYAKEQIYNVIDNRYRDHKPIIITTNLTVEELHKTEDLAEERIYGRILERCAPIRIDSTNFRELNRKKNLKIMKEKLS